MLLLYMVSTTAVFLLFGIWVAAFEQGKYNQQIRQINEKALMQSASACGTTLQDIYNYIYIEILDSSELVELLLAKEYSQKMSINFYRLSSRLGNFNSLIDSCYVINSSSDFACSTSDTYRNLKDFKDQDMIEKLEEMEEGELFRFIPRTVYGTENGNPYEKRYISIVFRQYSQGYFVVNLDYELFASMVNYRNYNENSRTLLLNKQGTVMIDSNGEWVGMPLSDAEYYKRLMEQEEKDGFFRLPVDGKRREICFRKGEAFDIKYLTITRYRLLDRDSLIHVVLASALAVVINLAFIFAGTTLLYRPIGKLSDFLEHREGEKIDEFQMLESTFFHLKKENEEFEQTRRERLLGNILKDKSVAGQEAERELLRLQETMDGPSFVCVNLYPEIETDKKEEIPLMLFAIDNVLRELTEKHMLVQSVKYDNYLSCIFNGDFTGGSPGGTEAENGNGILKEYSAKTEILELSLARLQEKIKEYFGLNVICAVGSVVHSVFDLAESAGGARTAAFFQFIREENAILYFEELPKRENPEGNYPAETAKNLLDAVKNCDKGKVRVGILSFFAEIAAYTYEQALKCVFMLENDLLRYEMRYDLKVNGSTWELTEFTGQSASLYKIQEIYLGHCLKMTDAYREIRDNNPNMLRIVEQVKELVEKNIGNPELTVNSVAQWVYLSNSYLRNIFREVTGETLSNYIIEKKLERICTLLEQTQMSAQQIADTMGFHSKSYLLTFFKNYMGMTPTQYRKEKTQENRETGG